VNVPESIARISSQAIIFWDSCPASRAQVLIGAGLWCLAFLIPFGGLLRAQISVSHADFVVAKPVLNMYAKPSEDSEVISQAIYGTGVLSFEKRDGWYQIRTADGYAGWAVASNLKALDGSSYAPDERSVHVAALTANIYRKPDVTLQAAILQLP